MAAGVKSLIAFWIGGGRSVPWVRPPRPLVATIARTNPIATLVRSNAMTGEVQRK